MGIPQVRTAIQQAMRRAERSPDRPTQEGASFAATLSTGSDAAGRSRKADRFEAFVSHRLPGRNVASAVEVLNGASVRSSQADVLATRAVPETSDDAGGPRAGEDTLPTRAVPETPDDVDAPRGDDTLPTRAVPETPDDVDVPRGGDTLPTRAVPESPDDAEAPRPGETLEVQIAKSLWQPWTHPGEPAVKDVVVAPSDIRAPLPESDAVDGPRTQAIPENPADLQR